MSYSQCKISRRDLGILHSWRILFFNIPNWFGCLKKSYKVLLLEPGIRIAPVPNRCGEFMLVIRLLNSRTSVLDGCETLMGCNQTVSLRRSIFDGTSPLERGSKTPFSIRDLRYFFKEVIDALRQWNLLYPRDLSRPINWPVAGCLFFEEAGLSNGRLWPSIFLSRRLLLSNR